MINSIVLLGALILSQVSADSPTTNNTVFTNPSNSSSAPIVWEVGTQQVIQWNTTASPVSLDLYQYISDTKTYLSGYIFEDYTNISIFVWEVTSVVDLDSTGQGNFHLKLVPPSYNGLPDIGVDSMAFTIRNSSVTNSSRASTSSSITSTTKISTTSTASTTTTSSLPPTTYPATITPSNVPAASSSRLSSSTRLGLGIGLGIGLVVFILLNAFAIIWYVRRWYLRQPSKAAQTANDENTHDAVNSAQYRPVGPVWEVDGNGLKSELSAWERREGVGELDGNAVRAELSATRK